MTFGTVAMTCITQHLLSNNSSLGSAKLFPDLPSPDSLTIFGYFLPQKTRSIEEMFMSACWPIQCQYWTQSETMDEREYFFYNKNNSENIHSGSRVDDYWTWQRCHICVFWVSSWMICSVGRVKHEWNKNECNFSVFNATAKEKIAKQKISFCWDQIVERCV